MKKENLCIHVGIDVGKFQLDVCLLERDKHFIVANDPMGIKQAVRALKRFKIARVVVEATGRYEFEFVTAAFDAGLPVCIVKPLLVRQFARASDQLAKTDKLDAMVIAQFGATMKPRFSIQQNKNQRAIKDLVTRRRQLVSLRTMEINREKIMGKHIARSCARIIKVLNKEIEWVEKQLTLKIEEESAWAERRTLLSTAPGVGDALIYSLLSDLPELGTLNNKQIAALAGLAPINCDSGKYKGTRRIQGGRTLIRNTLYMATLSAIQCNPVIGNFYKHLVEKGKPKKVALIAAMRKFLTILNAMVRDDSTWAY